MVHSPCISATVMAENTTNAIHPAWKTESVTVDARVNAVLKSGIPGHLSLALRVQENNLIANIDANTIEKIAWEKAQKLTPESIIRIAGYIHQLCDQISTNEGKVGVNSYQNGASDSAYAIDVIDLAVVAQASPNLPSFHREQGGALELEERLNNRVLDVRNAATGAIFKLHSGMCQLIVEFLSSKGFHWIHTPRIITATIAGDSEYFHLPYFGRDAWLAQSSQHHKQMALSMYMQRVFEIGPVFRAETKSRTSARHMTEFTVLDIAMVFQDNYHEVVEMIESMLVFVFRGLQERKQYQYLAEIVERRYPSARRFRAGLDAHGKVHRISFMEAKRVLGEQLGFEADHETDFTEQEESALGQYFRESPHFGKTDIFTIDQYPASMRQFNSQRSEDNTGLSNTWDTIVSGREICSGSERINSYDELCEAMREGICGPPLHPESEKWQAYLTAFKAGMPRHGGCGLGVNRLLQAFLGLNDIREATLFPRDVGRLSP